MLILVLGFHDPLHVLICSSENELECRRIVFMPVVYKAALHVVTIVRSHALHKTNSPGAETKTTKTLAQAQTRKAIKKKGTLLIHLEEAECS